MAKQSRRELISRMKPQYQTATRKEKQKIINDIIAICEYDRKYAIRLLNEPLSVSPMRRVRKPKYDDDVKQALSTLWYAANQICSKRLVPFLPVLIENLGNNDHIELTPPTEQLFWPSAQPRLIDCLNLNVDVSANRYRQPELVIF